jgi:hypothetical protein
MPKKYIKKWSPVPPPVNSKRDFVRRYEQGEFGNRSPTWHTLEEYNLAEYEGLVHLRNRIAGAETYYDVPGALAGYVWELLPKEQFYISAMAPTAKTILQGEAIQTPEGLSLLFTTVAKPMREALSFSSETVNRVVATMLIKHYMNAKSYDWFEHLLKVYPEHAIEFSVYSTCWGTLEGFNTVFWEVRNY